MTHQQRTALQYLAASVRTHYRSPMPYTAGALAEAVSAAAAAGCTEAQIAHVRAAAPGVPPSVGLILGAAGAEVRRMNHVLRLCAEVIRAACGLEEDEPVVLQGSPEHCRELALAAVAQMDEHIRARCEAAWEAGREAGKRDAERPVPEIYLSEYQCMPTPNPFAPKGDQP